MELTSRKQAVLKAIVKAYIETGEPIGSKSLALLLENPPSSATLRNEMSELCELGLLKQPHTSAGRIPTSDGYKLYVNSLMLESSLSLKEKAFIDEALSSLHCEAEQIPERAAQILNNITGLPTFTCLITERLPRLKRVEFLKIGRLSVMLLLITDDGRTRSRVIRFSRNFTDELKSTFEGLVESKIKGRAVNELTLAYMQGVAAQAGLHSLELLPLFTAIFEAAAEIEGSAVTIKDENALYNVCSNEKTAKKIVSLVKSKDPIISILERIENNVGVVFGSETGFGEILKDEILIAAKFNGGNKYKGYIGIIGQNRISYEHIIPCIEYVAEGLSSSMTEAQMDMED